MVMVPSSAGGMVQIEVKGINEVQRMLVSKSQMIKAGVDSACARSANMLQNEIQFSIMGLRSEPKSVRTGTYGNSISVDKKEDYHYVVEPTGYYLNGTEVKDVALMLEYGTSKMSERRHFRNSVARKEKEIVENIDNAIKVAINK